MKLQAWLTEKERIGRGFHDHSSIYEVFLGEFSWAPASLFHEDLVPDEEGWMGKDHNEFPVKVIVPAINYLSERASFDCSIEETISMEIPSRGLSVQMGLHWKGIEGQYCDSSGKVVVMNPSVSEAGPGVLLVQKDFFDRFLASNEYEVVWSVIGEKYIISDADIERLDMLGVFTLDSGKITGEMNVAYESNEQAN
jgi:hypothetical protein